MEKELVLEKVLQANIATLATVIKKISEDHKGNEGTWATNKYSKEKAFEILNNIKIEEIEDIIDKVKIPPELKEKLVDVDIMDYIVKPKSSL